MSFSSKIKTELCRQNLKDPECALAELAGMLHTGGILSFGAGHPALLLNTEHGDVVTRIFSLAKKCFQVDCALSQFSYGKLEETRLKGLQLPVAGGYDSQGNLTTDPGEIEKTRRVLPMGYWKGSGLSIALDLIATVLTNANSVKKIGTFEAETGLSQVMIAIDPGKFSSVQEMDAIADEILADIKASVPVEEGQAVRYPAERELKTREENLREGIPVIDEVWERICGL